jgi:hypothetical protein
MPAAHESHDSQLHQDCTIDSLRQMHAFQCPSQQLVALLVDEFRLPTFRRLATLAQIALALSEQMPFDSRRPQCVLHGSATVHAASEDRP